MRINYIKMFYDSRNYSMCFYFVFFYRMESISNKLIEVYQLYHTSYLNLLWFKLSEYVIYKLSLFFKISYTFVEK